jgi:hypothetical protein
MTGSMEMFGHVFIPRVVAAKRGAAGLAGTQVDPGGAHPDAFLADMFGGLFQLLDGLHVGANFFFGHDRRF